MDESLLTGKAVQVKKGGDAQVFSGTLVLGGEAIVVGTATGAASEIGKSLSLLETETPHLQRQPRRLVVWFALFGGAVSLSVVLLHGLTPGGDWLGATLAGISVGMAMLPEKFPIVLAVFMAFGAWHISTVSVLTRRASAIETFGAASVLRADKTGTLTENRTTIATSRLPHGKTHAAHTTQTPALKALA